MSETERMLRDYDWSMAQPNPSLPPPWLGDIDRRDDDDVEFCDEGEWEDEC